MSPYDMESSSSLIMGVIRILSNSKNDDERDVIRKKLEDCLTTSDQNLTKLVSDHHKDLRLVMQTFTKTCCSLQSSLAKLNNAEQRLADSREMLTSRLEELRKLGEELRTSEKVAALLDQADSIANLENSDQPKKLGPDPDVDHESALIEDNVFNPRASETSTLSLFKFSKSSYAICFEEHYKELTL